MASLVGKEVFGFNFEGHPTHTQQMVQYIGKIGKITFRGYDICQVEFDSGQRYNYPNSEIHKHLVELAPVEEPEEELTIEQIMDNMKDLMLKL